MRYKVFILVIFFMFLQGCDNGKSTADRRQLSSLVVRELVYYIGEKESVLKNIDAKKNEIDLNSRKVAMSTINDGNAIGLIEVDENGMVNAFYFNNGFSEEIKLFEMNKLKGVRDQTIFIYDLTEY